MITKETALKIARQVIPDLQMRSYKISDIPPSGGSRGNLPVNCWYLTYSAVTLNFAACGPGKTLFLCVDKETGEIKK